MIGSKCAVSPGHTDAERPPDLLLRDGTALPGLPDAIITQLSPYSKGKNGIFFQCIVKNSQNYHITIL